MMKGVDQFLSILVHVSTCAILMIDYDLCVCQNTALHLASYSGHIDAVCLLLTEGAIFVRNNSNRCFYDEVISSRHQELALAIVQHPR